MEVVLSILFLLLVASVGFFAGHTNGKDSNSDMLIRAEQERDAARSANDESYQMYSDEYDRHNQTRIDYNELLDDLEAAQELLAEADRSNKQLYSAIEIKNRHIAKLERTLDGRDNVLRALHARIEHLAE